MNTASLRLHSISLAVLSAVLMGAGCKSTPAPEQPPAAAQTPATPAATPPLVRDDQQIGTDIEAKIASEAALNGQSIQVIVANGVATLNGKVNNDASRALAAADSASIDGVKTVVNNLVVAPPKLAKAPAPAARAPHRPKEMAQATPPPPPPPPPAAQEQVQQVPPPPPPPPPAPVAKTVTLGA